MLEEKQRPWQVPFPTSATLRSRVKHAPFAPGLSSCAFLGSLAAPSRCGAMDQKAVTASWRRAHSWREWHVHREGAISFRVEVASFVPT